jgi:hypothetical protein
MRSFFAVSTLVLGLLLSAGAASAQSCDDDVQWASEDLVHYAEEFSETLYDHDGDSWLQDHAAEFADEARYLVRVAQRGSCARIRSAFRDLERQYDDLVEAYRESDLRFRSGVQRSFARLEEAYEFVRRQVEPQPIIIGG